MAELLKSKSTGVFFRSEWSPCLVNAFFISPANLDALLEDEEDDEERTSKAASRSGSFISALSDADGAAQDFPDEADDDDDLVGMDMDDLGLVNLHMQASKNLDVDSCVKIIPRS